MNERDPLRVSPRVRPPDPPFPEPVGALICDMHKITASEVPRHLPPTAAHDLALLLRAEEPTYGVQLPERLEARSRGPVGARR